MLLRRDVARSNFLSMAFPERDWKHLRTLSRVALDRYCARTLEESVAVIGDSTSSPHKRYLRLYELLQERNYRLAAAFDDLRRSAATKQLASMVALDLLTSDELNGFTLQTRDAAIGLSELQKKRVRIRRSP